MKDKDIHSKLILMICKRGITVLKIFLKREITVPHRLTGTKRRNVSTLFVRRPVNFTVSNPVCFRTSKVRQRVQRYSE